MSIRGQRQRSGHPGGPGDERTEGLNCPRPLPEGWQGLGVNPGESNSQRTVGGRQVNLPALQYLLPAWFSPGTGRVYHETHTWMPSPAQRLFQALRESAGRSRKPKAQLARRLFWKMLRGVGRPGFLCVSAGPSASGQGWVADGRDFCRTSF